MLNEAIKSEIKDLYDGSFASIRELSMLFNINNSEIMYFVDYKGRRKKHANAIRKWQKKNPEKTKEMNNRAVKKYNNTPKGKMTNYKNYLKNKKNGFYQTKKYKTGRHKYYLKNKERIMETHKKLYLKKKKEGYYNTKEFKEKRHNYYLKNKERIKRRRRKYYYEKK